MSACLAPRGRAEKAALSVVVEFDAPDEVSSDLSLRSKLLKPGSPLHFFVLALRRHLEETVPGGHMGDLAPRVILGGDKVTSEEIFFKRVRSLEGHRFTISEESLRERYDGPLGLLEITIPAPSTKAFAGLKELRLDVRGYLDRERSDRERSDSDEPDAVPEGANSTGLVEVMRLARREAAAFIRSCQPFAWANNQSTVWKLP